MHVVEDTGKVNTYERRKVVAGLSDGVNIEVKHGIGVGDVVRGPKKLSEE